MQEVVKAVIYKGDKYLLQLRDDDPAISCPNTWSFFGGGVDIGESHEEALKRELKEELNWKPVNMELIGEPSDLKTNCWSCAYRANHMQLGEDMVVRDMIPQDKMMEIVEDLSEMGVKAVTFSGGGEPLVYPYLAEAVKKLIEFNISFATLTNGARLKGEIAELFAHNGTWVRISMDGWDDESYMKYRGCGDGEYTKIINNIKNFKEMNGDCLLGVSLILDKDNAKHVSRQLKLYKSLGVNSVKVGAAIVSNHSLESNEYHRPFFPETKRLIGQAKEALEDGSFEIFDAYYELEDNFIKDYTWCPYLQILPVIGADLNIYPCQDKAYNLKNGLIGSIRSRRFKDFWFSDKDNYFKIVPSRDCKHHCVANVKNTLILEYLGADKGHIGFV